MWNSHWAGLVSAAVPPLPTSAQPVATQPPLPAAPPPPTPAPAPAIAAPAIATPVVPAVALPTMPVTNSPYGQYTAAQYAALTAEQQYALQQHWQQWQIYQQEYAKWHAQYGEQYNREMAAAATAAPVYQPPLPPQQPVMPQLAQVAALPAAVVPATPVAAPANVTNTNSPVVKITGAATMYKRPMEQQANAESAAPAWAAANYAQPPPTLSANSTAAPLPTLQNQQQFGNDWQLNRNFDVNQQQAQPITDRPQPTDNSNDNFNWGGQWNNRNNNNKNSNNMERSNFSGNTPHDMNNSNNQNNWFGNNRNQFSGGMNNPNKNCNNNNNNSGNNNWGNMRNEGNFGVNQHERNFGFKNKNNNNQNNRNWGNNNQNWRNKQQQQQQPPPQQQQQQQQQQQVKSDNSVELFDRYFHNWENEIEEWKRANESVLDRETFMSKVEEFDKQRNHLIERRRKIVQTRQQRSMNMLNNPNINPQDNMLQQQSMPIVKNTQHDNKFQQSIPQQLENTPQEEALPEETVETENLNTTIQANVDKNSVEAKQDMPEQAQLAAQEQIAIEEDLQAQDFERKRKSDLDIEAGSAKSTRKDVPAPNTLIINLDEEDDDEGNRQELASSIFGKSVGIPGLDLVEGSSSSMDKQDKQMTEQEQNVDIPVVDPTEIKAKESKPLAQYIQESSVGNLPIVIEALRDPENLHNILKVLAKVQGLTQQEIDDEKALRSEKLLQQLPGLLQKLQDQRKNFSQAEETEAKPTEGQVSFAEWSRRKSDVTSIKNPPNLINKLNVGNEDSDLKDNQISKEPDQTDKGFQTTPMVNNEGSSHFNLQESHDGSNTGRNFSGQNTEFGGPGSNFGGPGPNFGGAGPNFGGPGPNFDGFGPNTNFGGAGPNCGAFGSNSRNTGGDYGGPRSNYGGSGPNYGNSRQNFGGFGQNFGGNRSNFPGPGPNRGGNFGGCGPNFSGPGGGPNYNNQGSNMRNFGGNFGNRGPNAANNNFVGNMTNTASDDNNAFARRNPFKRGNQRPDFNMRGQNNNMNMQDMWMRDQQTDSAPSTSNMNDDQYYEPIKVIDYENTSIAAKVFERRARPDMLSSDNTYVEEFTPVKTIDYGHASGVVPFGRRQTNSTAANAIGRFGKRRNRKNKNKNKNKQKTMPQQTGQQQMNEETKQDAEADQDTNIQNATDPVSETEAAEEFEDETPTEDLKNTNVNVKDAEEVKEQAYEENKLSKEFEEISDTEDNLPDNNDEEDDAGLLVPPPPPMFSLPDLPLMKTLTNSAIFPSLASANDEVNATAKKKMHISYPSIENHNTISIDEILLQPGRYSRPKKICMILRGPPGSGKSFVARLIKEKEQQMGGGSIRILSIDDYFLIENDYEMKCPKTGKKIPKKEILYEYDSKMEETYMQYLIKSFKKTITDNLFDIVVVDCNNNSLRTLNEFYCHAKDSGFVPYIIDLLCDMETCLNRNVHDRTADDIRAIINNWKETPYHYIKIDISSLLENVVEMEDADDMVKEANQMQFATDDFTDVDIKTADTTTTAVQHDDEEDSLESVSSCGFLKSKWETDTNHLDQLARLDGISKSIHKRKATMEDYLQLDDWQPPVASNANNGKKRVRWADIEERRAQDKMREIGFVVGQTDWKRMMDPNAGARALNKTKYI